MTSYGRLVELRLRTVRALFSTRPIPARLSVDNVSMNLRAETVTGPYFRAIGVPPLLGSALHPDDDRAGISVLVVLGDIA